MSQAEWFIRELITARLDDATLKEGRYELLNGRVLIICAECLAPTGLF